MNQPVTIRTIDDAIAAVPALLGYHPHEDLVVVVVHRRIEVTVRASLSQVSTPQGLTAQLGHLPERFPGSDFLIVGFSADARAGLAVVRLAAETFGAEHVADAVATDGARWWSLFCDDSPACRRGHTLMSSSTAAAMADGQDVAASREELAASVAGPDNERAVAEWPDNVDAQDWAAHADDREALDLLRAVLTSTDEPDTITALRLAHVMTRDDLAVAAWHAANAAMAPRLLTVWRAAVAHAPAPVAVAPLMLAGQAAWLTGNGALTGCTLERALRLNRWHPLFGALAAIVCAGHDPRLWEAMDHDPAAVATGRFDPVTA